MLVQGLVACGGALESDGPPTPPAPKLALEQFLPSMTEALCSNLDSCCATIGKSARTDCSLLVEQTWQPLLDYARTIQATYDAEQGALCVEAYRHAYETCNDLKVERYPLDRACLSVFSRGGASSEPGASCKFSVDCKGATGRRARCVNISGKSGFCQTQREAELGQICVSTVREVAIHCPQGAICTSDSYCRTRYALGERCGDMGSDDCEPGAVCDRSGLCVAAQSTGSDCEASTQCDNYACQEHTCHKTPDPMLQLSLYCD